jgi:hypothetical protein
MEGANQTLVALGLLVAFVVCSYRAARSARAPELWGILASTALTADTLVIQRARVLTIPLVFVTIIIALYWSARRHAERLDAEEEK